MGNITNCKKPSGKFYFKKRLLKFQVREDLINDDDMLHLFFGMFNLLKQSAEKKIRDKYLIKINELEKELNFYRSVN
jgi:hypothetical protein